jgi:X-X-X-Leu-X-X-Gly heptad repeat protein
MMTLVSIVLMGGNYLFPVDIVHEILGVALFVLWAVHIALNRRWYASLAQASKLITSTNANDRRSYGGIFRGKYNPYRIMQTLINCCILICTTFLMISGIILSNHVFTFLNIQGGLGFARIAHLLASHWYYLFMSLHIGMHVGMIENKIKQKRKDSHPEHNTSHPEHNICHSGYNISHPELVSGSFAEEMPNQVRHDSSSSLHDSSSSLHDSSSSLHDGSSSLHDGSSSLHDGSSSQQECHSRAPTRESPNTEIIGSSPIMTLVGKILLALVCLYGLYAFIARGVWKYLILQQQFFFFDLERGYILFAIDYISIIILFATLSHLLAKSLKKGKL